MDLGKKYTCFECGTKFYDLGRPEPICPRCGVDQRLAPGSGYTPPQEERPNRSKEDTAESEESAELGAPVDLDEEFIEDADTDYDAEAPIAAPDPLVVEDEEESFD